MSDVPLRLPVNCVLSHHYFATADMADIHGGVLRIVADSGAWSAHSQGQPVDARAFYAWALRWAPWFAWTASLDVIGDREASWENWRTSPASLSLVPSIHYGDDPATLDRYAEAGATLVGLGGMVPRRSEAPRILRWAAGVMAYAERAWPGLRFHGWGISHPDLLAALPWWSVDSSGFGSAYRYGRMRLWDDRAKTNRSVALDGRAVAGSAELLRSYGVPWGDALTSRSDNRRILFRAGIASLQRQEDWLRKRHAVTPPPGLEAWGPGPHLHAVDAARGHWRHIKPLEDAA